MPKSPPIAFDRHDSVFQLAWPTVLTYFAFAARQFTDTWMVGQLGEDSLAALLPAQQLLYVIQGFSFGLMSALNTCGSQANQRFGPVSSGTYAWQGFIIAIIFGSLAASLSLVSESIFGIFNHERAVFLNEVAYFEICVLAVPAQFLAGMLANFFFAAKKPLIPMFGGMAHVLLNIVFNYIFMFGIPGLIEPMGIVGAAWGTIVASVVWAGLLFGIFLLLPSLRIYRTSKPRFSLKKIWDLLKIGVPNGCIDVTDTLFWNLALVVFVGSFGTEHLAASAIIFSLLMLFVVPGDGMGVALTTLVGYHFGNKDIQGARKRVYRTLLYNLLFMVSAGLICWGMRKPIFESFSDSPLVCAVGMELIILLPLILAIDACLYVYDNALSGVGDAIWPLRANLVINTLLIGAGGWVVVTYFSHFESFGIWLVIAANRAVVTVALVLRWASGKWQQNQSISEVD